MNDEELTHLADLVRLELTDDEKVQLGANFNKILKYMEDLNGIDTDHVDPCHHVLQGTLEPAEDEVADLLPLEDFMNNAPDHVGGMVRVPPVING